MEGRLKLETNSTKDARYLQNVGRRMAREDPYLSSRSTLMLRGNWTNWMARIGAIFAHSRRRTVAAGRANQQWQRCDVRLKEALTRCSTLDFGHVLCPLHGSFRQKAQLWLCPVPRFVARTFVTFWLPSRPRPCPRLSAKNTHRAGTEPCEMAFVYPSQSTISANAKNNDVKAE